VSRPLHPTARACGKVILLGEHAVVHGRPALAAGLPGGLTLHARPSTEVTAPLGLRIPAWGLDLDLERDVEHPVARACRAVLEHVGGPRRGYLVEGESTLPARAGLGSSAALTVALARLVLGEQAPAAEVVEASLAGERVFHGEPSGIDSWIATRGGVLWFVRGQVPEPVALGAALPIVVLASGVPRSTADQVAKVSRRLERHPTATLAIFDAIAALVVEGRHALERGHLGALAEVIEMNHGLLAALDVSSPTLDRLVARAREAGARAAKLTGAGGGGCVIALPAVDGSASLVAALESDETLAFAVCIDRAAETPPSAASTSATTPAPRTHRADGEQNDR
jgi:mevalonate kinase